MRFRKSRNRHNAVSAPFQSQMSPQNVPGRAETEVQPYGVRIEGDTCYLVFQVREFYEHVFDVSFHFVEDAGVSPCKTHVVRSTYHAASTDRLAELMVIAGFKEVHRLDGEYERQNKLNADPSGPSLVAEVDRELVGGLSFQTDAL